MKKAHELRQIVNRRTMTSEQGVLEMNVHAAVAVFYIEYDRVPADLTPAPDDAQSAIACGHHSGQVHCADFEVARHGDRFLPDRRVQNPLNNYLLTGFYKCAVCVGVAFAYSLRQFCG